MPRIIGCCELCARMTGSSLSDDLTTRTLYCEAYPDGVPEAVYHAGHFYPKPGDNGLQFKLIEGIKLPEYIEQSQEKEDANYRGYAEYYGELDMTEDEFREKMKREHGDDYLLYIKPTREAMPII